MKLEVSVAEVIEVFKEIQEIKKQPGRILEMVKTEVPKSHRGLFERDNAG